MKSWKIIMKIVFVSKRRQKEKKCWKKIEKVQNPISNVILSVVRLLSKEMQKNLCGNKKRLNKIMRRKQKRFFYYFFSFIASLIEFTAFCDIYAYQQILSLYRTKNN